MSSPRLLLVTPSFHGYGSSIAGALERRGYAVTTHRYDDRSHPTRVVDKLLRDLPQRLGRDVGSHDRQTALAARRLRAVRPDVLFVVKGDDLGLDFWSEAQRYPRRALWLYDELRRTRHNTQTLDAAGPVASYSRLDVADLAAQGRSAVHVPLAFDSHLPFDRFPPVDEAVLVGARYPARERLLRDLADRRTPVRAFGRDWSANVGDRLRTWRLRTPDLPAGRELTRSGAYAVMAAAAAALNVHGDQDGFTMRTFEAPGVGGLELVDRLDVTEFYDVGREVLAFTTADEAAELIQRARRDRAWAKTIRRNGKARTLAEHTLDHRVARLEHLWR